MEVNHRVHKKKYTKKQGEERKQTNRNAPALLLQLHAQQLEIVDAPQLVVKAT
jgi:hypothetical protein